MAYFPTRVPNTLAGGTGISIDFPLVLFELLDDMVAIGWRILGSSDHSTGFENTGQTGGGSVDPGNPWGAFSVIRSGGAGANGMANATFNVGSCWIRLATPSDAAVYREYLWTLDYGSGISVGDWRLETTMDLSGFNTGGTINLRPTGIDSIALAGNQVATLPGSPPSTDFRTWIPSATGNYSHWVLGDVDDEYSFIYLNRRATDEGVWGVWGLDQISPVLGGTNPPTTNDPDPHYHLISHLSSNGSSFDCFDTTGGAGRSDIGTSGLRVEDFTGTQQVERLIVASILLGESGPPAEAGHYQMALGQIIEGDGSASLAALGTSPGFNTGYSTNAVPVLKQAVAPAFFKGFARGRLIRNVSFNQAIPNTTIDTSLPLAEQTRARFGNMGLSIPWPNGAGIS